MQTLELPPPLVSVIIPMYNAEGYITQALQSVLQETTIPLEVIVVNDRSSDRSLERVQAIQDARLRVVNGAKAGISTTMNLGLAAARGTIIMRCDADDLFTPGRIASQANWLLQHPDYGAVCGSYDIIAPNGSFVLQHDTGGTPEEVTDELQQGITRTHLCTFAIRTDILRLLGGFRPYFETGEDIDLQLRLADICRVFYQIESRYCYRLHNDSITHMIPSERRVFFDRIARTFQQQRQHQGQDDLQHGIFPPIPQGSESRSYSSNEQIQGFLQGRAWQALSQGQRRNALKLGVRSLLANPGHLPTWSNFLVLLAKLPTQKAQPAPGHPNRPMAEAPQPPAEPVTSELNRDA
ncbi:MAG TPA: glycosyltransferase family A protein [Candidatus Obscuribacterales bacterium]